MCLREYRSSVRRLVDLAAMQSHVSEAIQNVVQLALLEKVEVIEANQSDKKRVQHLLGPVSVLLVEVLSVLEKAGKLKGLSPSDCNLIHSLVGCDKQGLHSDWDPDDVKDHAKENKGKKSLGVILALEEGSRFMVWCKRQNREVSVELSPGEVLVFEGGVIHAGAEYRTQCNTRLHLYLDDLPGLVRMGGFSHGGLSWGDLE